MSSGVPEVDIAAWVGQYLWPFSRISAFVFAAPVLGSQVVPARLRLLLCLLLTGIVASALPSLPRCSVLTLDAWLVVVEQTLIGLTMGWILQLVFQALELSGQVVATQSGLGFSSLIDPNSGVSVASLSQLYVMLATLIFLAMNGHLVMIDYLFRSFTVLPLGRSPGLDLPWADLLAAGGWVFSAGLIASLPAAVALLVVNVALGIITRASPQLNIFSIGFPITLMLGLLAVWLSLRGFTDLFSALSDEAFARLQHFLRP